jgi:transposase-like protein
MPCRYPTEFRQRAIALVREGRQVKRTATDLGIHVVTLNRPWFPAESFHQKESGMKPGTAQFPMSREMRFLCPERTQFSN